MPYTGPVNTRQIGPNPLGRQLYWSEVDNNFLYLEQLALQGGGAAIITKSALDLLIAANDLVPGTSYIISGVDVPLYGGTTILLQAATTNTLSLSGHGIFYNPKYINTQATPSNGYGIWQASNAYALGDTTIWGGMHWSNTSGNVGTAVDKYELSSSDWGVIPFDDINYNVAVDVIHYDYAQDIIIRRKDKWNNDVDGTWQWFFEISDPAGNYGYGNPIKDFQWGNGSDEFVLYDYQVLGVQENYVKDSYLECLNFIGHDLRLNQLSQKSYFYNNIVDENSIFSGNTLSVSSGIHNNTLVNSYIQQNTLVSSYINDNTYIGQGAMQNNILQNAYIAYNTLYYSGISVNTLIDSGIENNDLNGSQIIGNRSVGGTFGDNIMLNSTMNYNTVNTGSISSNDLTSSVISTNILNNGYIFNNVLSVTYIWQNTLNNSEFDFSAGGVITSKILKFINAEYVAISEDISAATIIFGAYTKQIFKNAAGVNRMSYYDSSDVLTIVNINA